MRVLLVNSLYAPYLFGGAERMVQSLAVQLAARGHEVVVASLAPARTGGVATVDGVRVHYVPLDNVYPLGAPDARPAGLKPLWHLADCANPFMARRLAEVIRAERPTIVHTHNVAGFSAMAWSASDRAGLPIVHTLHDYYLLCIRSTMFAHGANCERQHLACAAMSAPKKRMSRRVSAVVGVSEFVLRRHREAGTFSGVPSRVIPNSSRFPVRASSTAGTVAGPLRIGFLGRLEPAKGVEVLLREVARLRETELVLTLAGVGGDEYVRALRASFDSPRIRFVGASDAASVLADSDVLVMPSLSNEVSPLVVYEAFAFGVPVIGSRRGGVPELVQHGVTGELFEPTDEGALGDILARWAADRSALPAMGAACLRMAAGWQPEANAERYEHLYGEVLAGRATAVPA